MIVVTTLVRLEHSLGLYKSSQKHSREKEYKSIKGFSIRYLATFNLTALYLSRQSVIYRAQSLPTIELEVSLC